MCAGAGTARNDPINSKGTPRGPGRTGLPPAGGGGRRQGGNSSPGRVPVDHNARSRRRRQQSPEHLPRQPTTQQQQHAYPPHYYAFQQYAGQPATSGGSGGNGPPDGSPGGPPHGGNNNNYGFPMGGNFPYQGNLGGNMLVAIIPEMVDLQHLQDPLDPQKVVLLVMILTVNREEMVFPVPTVIELIVDVKLLLLTRHVTHL